MEHRGSSRSERAAAVLRESGYNAQALDGGFPAWKAAGYPIQERGFFKVKLTALSQRGQFVERF